MSWPDSFPEGCPPSEALPISGIFFRCVNSDPPNQDDFLSAIEKNPRRRNPEDECKLYGVSMYTQIDDIKRLRNISPPFREMQIAQGQLGSEHGVMRNTKSKYGNSHYTMWFFKEIDVSSNFSVIPIEEVRE